MKRLLTVVPLLAVISTVHCAALAQTYPARPIRLVIAFPPGGSADVLARMFAPRLSESLAQPVVIDHRPGGGQLIASDIVAKAIPDGHTLFLQGVTHVINPGLLKSLPYDTLRDFAPITMVMDSPLMFVANPAAGINNIPQLVAAAKAAPGKLNYGSSGQGTGGHLAVELLKHMAQINIVQVPYKGAGPALVGLMGGEVQINCTSPLGALPHVKTGRIRALAVTSAQRSRTVPDVPTVAESGVPGYHATVWYALFAPGKTPSSVVQRLHAETVKIIKAPAVVAQLQNQGAEPVVNQPHELQKFLQTEIKRWTELIQAAQITPE